MSSQKCYIHEIHVEAPSCSPQSPLRLLAARLIPPLAAI
jgi:hypothetical protein